MTGLKYIDNNNYAQYFIQVQLVVWLIKSLPRYVFLWFHKLLVSELLVYGIAVYPFTNQWRSPIQSPARPFLFFGPRIDKSYRDRIHLSQGSLCGKCCQWLGEIIVQITGNRDYGMDRWTGRCHITEIMLKMALNTFSDDVPPPTSDACEREVFSSLVNKLC